MTKREEILNNENYIPILDKGFVGLIDVMPKNKGEGDKAIVSAARVSYGKGTKTVRDDRNLIRYLLRNGHTSPFEMVEFKFHLKVPIFVARQHIRHRTANVNEISGRYSIMRNEFYLPSEENIKPQSKENKQGREGSYSNLISEYIINKIRDVYNISYSVYNELISEDIDLARELARIVLPLSNYTEMYWKIDLNNLFKYLKLRMDLHAQYEIRVVAEAMFKLAREYAPIAFEAFEDYVLNSVQLSKKEVEFVRSVIKNNFNREELIEKLNSLNLSKREVDEFVKKFFV